MQILITLIIFLIISLIITFYFNLLKSQNSYSQNKLKDIVPEFNNMLKIFFNKYSFFYFAIFFLVSFLIAFFLLTNFKNLIINSAILPLMLYFIIPRVAIYFEQTKVTISENKIDIIEALFLKYYNCTLIGFLSGYSVKLIDNWFFLKIFPFYWFIFNFFVILVLTVLTLQKDIYVRE